MLNLFNEYKNSGRISEALLVGRNVFNRNPENCEVFSAYFSYLCTLAETLPSFIDKCNFAEQANIALAFYSENAELTREAVEAIAAQQQRINVIFKKLDEIKTEKSENERAMVESHNANCLKELLSFKDSLKHSSTQEEFDELLIKLGQIDSTIEKESFTNEQSSIYDSLTKDHSTLISEKMRQLEYQKNLSYNQQAADAFASAFEKFRKDENKYKNQTQLFALVSTTLFAYDASRLFNETLIYYNHVYSYIFSKLDDDGKLALTRYSIECERKLR